MCGALNLMDFLNFLDHLIWYILILLLFYTLLINRKPAIGELHHIEEGNGKYVHSVGKSFFFIQMISFFCYKFDVFDGGICVYGSQRARERKRDRASVDTHREIYCRRMTNMQLFYVCLCVCICMCESICTNVNHTSYEAFIPIVFLHFYKYSVQAFFSCFTMQ